MKKQDNKKRRFIRPSPNEEAAIVQSEQERRKKLRLKQVREQEKAFSLKVCQNIKNRRENELKILSEELQKQWTEKQLNEQKTLKDKYSKNLSKIGDGHRAAILDQKSIKKDGRVLTKQEKKRAFDRHNEAIQQLIIRKEEEQAILQYQINARAKAMEVEKARSAAISSLPVTKDVLLDLELVKDQRPLPRKVEDFKSTHFHLQKPIIQVERMDKENQVDARFAAEAAEFEIQGAIEETQKSQAEQAEKALLRHRHALAQLKIEEDRKQLMDELGELERKDRQRRQEAVAKIPVHIFQPPHKRVEDAEERQYDLEQAFEDMYMLQTGYTGDLTIALELSDGPLFPEQHQFLVPDKRREDQLEDSIPMLPPEEPSDGQSIGEAQQNTIPSQKREGFTPLGERVIEGDKQLDSKLPKGEDAVKRLLLRIQRQREQAKDGQSVKEQKMAIATHKAVKSTGSRINIMTPLPEEEELPSDEDVSCTFPPHRHPTAKEPSTAKDSSKGSERKLPEAQVLLHPNEEARQARTITSHKDKENIVDIQKRTPSAGDEHELQKQRKLTQQLEEQRIIQLRLEEQLKEYHKKFQALSSETFPEPIDDNARLQPGDISKETLDGENLFNQVSDEMDSVEDKSIDDNGEYSLPSIESGVLSTDEQTADAASESSSSVSDVWPLLTKPSQSSAEVKTLHHMPSQEKRSSTDYSSHSSNRGLYATDPRERSPLSFKRLETTGDSFPRNSSSESEDRHESEDLSSSSGSLDCKHNKIPTRDVSHETTPAQPSPIPDSTSTDSNRINVLTSQRASVKTTDPLSKSSYLGPSKRLPEVQCSFQNQCQKAISVVHYNPNPATSKSQLSQTPEGTPNYLEEYRKKWEEEKMLIENQRQIIKRKQEQQLQRMRYYKNILDKYESGSPDAAPSVPLTTKTAILKSHSEHDVSGPRHTNGSSVFNQKNEKLSMNRDANRHARLQESSSSFDYSFRKSFPHTSASNTSGPLENRFSMASKDSRASASDFSLPSSGTEYHSLPLSADPSVIGTNLDLANESRSSITTLSELHEIMSKFTSSSENDKKAERMSWSQYLTEGVSKPIDGTTINTVPSRAQPSSAFTHLKHSFSLTQSASDTGTQSMSYFPSKSSSQSEVIPRRYDSFSDTSETSLHGQEVDVFSEDKVNQNAQSLAASITKQSGKHPQIIAESDGFHPESNASQRHQLQKQQTMDFPPFSRVSSEVSGTSSESLASGSAAHKWIVSPKASQQPSNTAEPIGRTACFDVQTTNNVENTTVDNNSSSDQLIHHLMLTKLKSQNIGALEPQKQRFEDTQAIKNIQTLNSESILELPQAMIPSEAYQRTTVTSHSVGKLSNLDNQDVNGVKSTSVEAHKGLPSDCRVVSNAQSSTSDSSSEFYQWVTPSKAGVQSLNPIKPSSTVSTVRRPTTRTESSAPLWVFPSKASVETVRTASSLGTHNSSNVQNIMGSESSSPRHQWFLPGKSSVQSVCSVEPLKGVNVDNEAASDIQSSSSSLHQWFLPPKASANTQGSADDSSPDLSVSKSARENPIQWYFPKKTSSQSVALQVSMYEASSPDQSVFNSASVDWQSATSPLVVSAPVSNWPGLSSIASSNLPYTESNSSSSTSENIKERLRNMGDVLGRLDKLLDVPSPTLSLSSGSLETDVGSNLSQSDHSTSTSTTVRPEKGTEKESISESLIQAEDESKGKVSLPDIEIGENSQNSTNKSSLESDTVSLQEAFAARKQDFVAKSLARVARAKEKRFEVKPRVNLKGKSTEKHQVKTAKKKQSSDVKK